MTTKPTCETCPYFEVAVYSSTGDYCNYHPPVEYEIETLQETIELRSVQPTTWADRVCSAHPDLATVALRPLTP